MAPYLNLCSKTLHFLASYINLVFIVPIYQNVYQICIFLWLLFCKKIMSNSLHWYAFSPLCVYKCHWRLPYFESFPKDYTDIFPQCGCILMCLKNNIMWNRLVIWLFLCLYIQMCLKINIIWKSLVTIATLIWLISSLYF